MVNITALIALREKLAERLIMKYSYVIPSLISYLILSFSSGVGSMYSLYYSFFIIISQVSYTTISITWRIIRTTSLLISIINANLAFPICKWWRCFFRLFFLSMILSTFSFLIGLSCS